MGLRRRPAARGDLAQFVLVVGYAAARAAQRERGTDDDGITLFIGEVHRRLHVVGDDGRYDGLTDGLHGVLEKLSVLRLVDGLGLHAQQTDVVLFEEAALVQLHGERQARLAAQRRQYAVRLLFEDDALEHLHGERFDVYLVGHRLVRHYGGGVGVDEHDLYLLVLEGVACLRARVIELRGLTYGDRAGPDHEHFLYILVFRHRTPPCPSSL